MTLVTPQILDDLVRRANQLGFLSVPEYCLQIEDTLKKVRGSLDDCWRQRRELAGERDELKKALSFYADAGLYEDWHDTGRTERQETTTPVAVFEHGEFSHIDSELDEFDAPVWETTISEDRGARAREALGLDDDREGV